MLRGAYPPPPLVSSKRPICMTHFFTSCGLVPEERLELSWCCHRRILSPLRLPVPPFRLGLDEEVKIIIAEDACFRVRLCAAARAHRPAPPAAAQREPPAAPSARRRARRSGLRRPSGAGR